MTAVSPRTPLHVVLVDDSDVIRDVVRLALEQEDDFHVVTEAGDGESGIAAASEHQPDLVLLDIAMPVMDGLQALPHIREQSPRSVVIMLTGIAETAGALSAVEQGAHGYIRKGFGRQELMDQIREVVAFQFSRRDRDDRKSALGIVDGRD